MYYIVIIVVFWHLTTGARINYHNYKLYQFKPKEGVLDVLKHVEETGSRFDENGERMFLIDIFAEPNRDQKLAYLLVAPEFDSNFHNIIKKHHVDDLQLVKSNIQSDFVVERNEQIKQKRRRRRNVFMSGGPNELRSFDIFAYHRYEEIISHLKSVAKYRPDMVTFLNISKSFEGRDLVGLKITSPNSHAVKPSVFIDAGIHAREHISIAVGIYMIDRLVNQYETNDRVKWMLNSFDWYIVPMANPDGFVFSMDVDRLWRKTRSINEKVNRWCRGADANRNWSFRWGQIGATRSPCSNTYAGEHPLSEPEVVGLKEFIKNNVRNLKVYASLHAYGQLLLSPWGYTSERPSNYMDQKIAAQYATEAIRNETGAIYRYGTIAEAIYPASGTSIDYMQNYGVPFVYGIELRPLENDPAGFTIPASEIEPAGREMMAALFKICEYVSGKLPKKMFLKRRRQ